MTSLVGVGVLEKEDINPSSPSTMEDRLRHAELLVRQLEDTNLELRAHLASVTSIDDHTDGPTIANNSSSTLQSSQKQLQPQKHKSISPTKPPHQPQASFSATSAVELKHIHDQLLHKDRRIMELNEELMEKERAIIDLQEACREQGQLAATRRQAAQLVTERLNQLDSRQVRDAATETSTSTFSNGDAPAASKARRGLTEAAGAAGKKRREREEASPGRAVPQLQLGSSRGREKGGGSDRGLGSRRVTLEGGIGGLGGGGGGSPPPTDPSEMMRLQEDEEWLSTASAEPTFITAATEENEFPSRVLQTAHPYSSLYSSSSNKKVTFDLVKSRPPKSAKAHSSPEKGKFSSPATPHPAAGTTSSKLPLAEEDGAGAVRESVAKFEFPPPSTMGVPSGGGDGDLAELLAENEQLRRVITEMESANQLQHVQPQGIAHAAEASSEDVRERRISQLERELTERQREAKMQMLKARAAAQARIRELEATISGMLCTGAKEMESMKAVNETLRLSREWTLGENAKLHEQVTQLRSKMEDLHGELDASLNANQLTRSRLDDEQKRTERLHAEIVQQRAQVAQINEDKGVLQGEVEKMTEAIHAQADFISLLEGDIVVYEAHVGILRDSLQGASKSEDRQHIKSKAFAAKLNALEAEKEEIAKKNKDERLRTKALNVKIACLEQERDQLRKELQQQQQQPLQQPTAQVLLSERNLGQRPATIGAAITHPSDENIWKQEQSPSDRSKQVDEGIQTSGAWDEMLIELRLENEAIRDEKSTLLAQLQLAKEESDRHQMHHSKSQHKLQEVESELNHTSGEVAQLVDNVKTIVGELGIELEPLKNDGENEMGENSEVDVVATSNAWLETLAGQYRQLKLERDALKEQLDLAKLAVTELEQVEREVEKMKQQMEIDKQSTESRWLEVKSQLAERDAALTAAEGQCYEMLQKAGGLENELAQLRERHAQILSSKQQLELSIDETNRRMAELTSEKKCMEQRLAGLAEENGQMSSTLAQEKERHERLVGILQDEVEKYKGGGGGIGEVLLTAASSRQSSVVVTADEQQAAKVVKCQSAETGLAPIVSSKSSIAFTKSVGCQVTQSPLPSTNSTGVATMDHDEDVIAQIPHPEELETMEAKLQSSRLEANQLRAELAELQTSYEAKVAELVNEHEGQINEYNKRVVDSERYLQQLEENERLCNELEARLSAKDAEVGALTKEAEALARELEMLRGEVQARKDSDINRDTEDRLHATLAAVDAEFDEEDRIAVECRVATSDANTQTTCELPVINETTSAIPHQHLPRLSPTSSPHIHDEVEQLKSRMSHATNLIEEGVRGELEEVERILAVNEELQTAVEVLKAEIWALTNELGKQLAEYSKIQPRVAELEAELTAARLLQQQHEQDDVERQKDHLVAMVDDSTQCNAPPSPPLVDDETEANSLHQQHLLLLQSPPPPSSPPAPPPAPRAGASPTLSHNTIHMHNAILAARLVAKSTDNDSLQRFNAELTRANVELTSRVEELEASLDELRKAAATGGVGETSVEPAPIEYTAIICELSANEELASASLSLPCRGVSRAEGVELSVVVMETSSTKPRKSGKLKTKSAAKPKKPKENEGGANKLEELCPATTPRILPLTEETRGSKTALPKLPVSAAVYAHDDDDIFEHAAEECGDEGPVGGGATVGEDERSRAKEAHKKTEAENDDDGWGDW